MLFAETEAFSIPNLVSNLGAAGAVVVVVGYFLAHLRSERSDVALLIKDLNDRHDSSLRAVEDKFQRIFDQQSAVIQAVALAIKDTEATMRVHCTTLAHLEQTVQSLHRFLEGGGRQPYTSDDQCAREPLDQG